MIVFGSSLSPFVRKVLVYAAEKGIAVESRPLGLGSDDPEFLAVSPFRKIPALTDGDFSISDSTAIVTYLEALHPEPALIPAEPRARARAIWFEEFADTLVFKTMGAIFFNRIVSPKFLGQPGDLAAADKAEADELPLLLDYLEGQIPESGFLVEDRLTIADIAVASPFANFDYCGCALGDRPKVKAYVGEILGRPSFAGLIAREKGFLAKAA